MNPRIIIFVFFVVLVFARYIDTRPKYVDGDRVKIITTVYSEPIKYERSQYFKVNNLKVYLPKYPEISYGDKVEINGKVEEDKLVDVSFKVLEREAGYFSDIRNRIIAFYKKSLPEPYSSLVAGIALGSKQMTESFWALLRQTGTAHVVVASGTNVSFVSSFLISALTRFMMRKKAVFISIAGIVIYAFLSGFDAPIVRASIMGIILLFGQLTGRITDTWTILLYTSMSMLLYKPEWIKDLGFILSFVATSSLLLFQKKVDMRLKFIPNILREGFSTSISAQIGVAPIIFASFGQFNILSPVINALILWTIPYIMTLGIFAGLVGLILPLIGQLVLFIVFPFLYYFNQILLIFNF